MTCAAGNGRTMQSSRVVAKLGEAAYRERSRGQPLIAPPRPELRRKERWKRTKAAIGRRQAMNMAARKTPSEVCDWIAGSRTESGCLSGLASTRSGQRKSFQEASTAKTETTPRIGFDIGSTME